MSNFFSEFSDKSACDNTLMCSFAPSSYALEELLLNEIKQIAFYVSKLQEFSAPYEERIMQNAIRALSVIIINTAFRFDDYKKLIYGLEEDKNEIREKYLKLVKKNNLRYEPVESPLKLPQNPNPTNLLKAGEVLVVEKQQEQDRKKLDLFELIVIFAKTTSINLEKLRSLSYENPELNFKVLKFLNYTNIQTNKNEKLKKKICEFSEVSLEILKILNRKYEEKFGKRQTAEIPLNIKKGKAILVSGSDLSELYALLEASSGRDIDIYTNSSLFMAFAYPGFLKFKNLRAHFGSENAPVDFVNFKGPIYTTQNFLQKTDYLRRGIIYTTKIVSPERMIRIENNNFAPLFDEAEKTEGFLEEDETQKTPAILKFDKDEIKRQIEKAKNKELYVVIGSYKKDEMTTRFSGKNIIELASPVEIELLIHILDNADCTNLSLVFTHCGAVTINILLSVLYLSPKKIYFKKCPTSLINPHVISALTEIFEVEMI